MYLENFIQRNDKKSLWSHRKMMKQKPKISRHPRNKTIRKNQKACKHVRRFIVTLYNEERSSEEERRVDALALRAEERRDKLRKAAERSKYPLTRRYLNGETRQEGLLSPCTESIGVRREPGELKHLSSRRKRKKNRFCE